MDEETSTIVEAVIGVVGEIVRHIATRALEEACLPQRMNTVDGGQSKIRSGQKQSNGINKGVHSCTSKFQNGLARPSLWVGMLTTPPPIAVASIVDIGICVHEGDATMLRHYCAVTVKEMFV